MDHSGGLNVAYALLLALYQRRGPAPACAWI